MQAVRVDRTTARDNGRSRHPYGVTRFHLQFDLQDVAAYAARYPSGDDAEALAIGQAGRERGDYTLTEFKACAGGRPRTLDRGLWQWSAEHDMSPPESANC